MQISEYGDQLSRLGQKVHFNDGICWLNVKPGYCRTAWRMQTITPGSARPSFRHSYLGFSHASDITNSSKSDYRILRRELPSGGSFSIDSLSANRRSKVRRGLKRCSITIATDLSPYLNQMMDAAIDARVRTGTGKPVEYYRENSVAWQQELVELSEMKDNYFLLSIIDDCVIAYFHCIVVEQSMSITAAKSHSRFLSDYPNDALVFSALDYAFNHWDCNAVLYGDYASQDEKLNEFKLGYGFEVYSVPQFEHLTTGGRLVKKLFVGSN